MSPFASKIVEIISNIPKGRVMTYGQIAHMAGNPKAARCVVFVLNRYSLEYNLPWYRVLNKSGEIKIKDLSMKNLQKKFLEDEGIVVNEYKIDLSIYLA